MYLGDFGTWRFKFVWFRVRLGPHIFAQQPPGEEIITGDFQGLYTLKILKMRLLLVLY